MCVPDTDHPTRQTKRNQGSTERVCTHSRQPGGGFSRVRLFEELFGEEFLGSFAVHRVFAIDSLSLCKKGAPKIQHSHSDDRRMKIKRPYLSFQSCHIIIILWLPFLPTTPPHWNCVPSFRESLTHPPLICVCVGFCAPFSLGHYFTPTVAINPQPLPQYRCQRSVFFFLSSLFLFASLQCVRVRGWVGR